MLFTLFLAMTLNIIFLVKLALSSNNGLRFLLFVLSGFWILSFLVRPALSLYSMQRDLLSIVTDLRISSTSDEFVYPSFLIVSGCFIFNLTVFLAKSFLGQSFLRHFKLKNSQGSPQLVIFGLILGLSSLLIEFSAYRNPFSKSLYPMVVFMYSAYIWNRRNFSYSKRRDALVHLVGISATVAVGLFQNNSKGVILTPLIVWLWTSSFWSKVNVPFKKFLAGLLIGAFLILFFTLLQFFKLDDLSNNNTILRSSEFPLYLLPFLVLGQRFDMFPRVVDAVFAQGSLGGLSSWLNWILDSLRWNFTSGRQERSFGEIWNQNVSAISIAGAGQSRVSVAQGMIAESYMWLGFFSLVVGSVLMALVFVFVGRLLDGSNISAFFAFTLIAHSTLFESGLVQFASSLSASLKMLVVLLLFKLLLYRNDGRIIKTST
jgi:hypothetical protein